MAWLACSLRRAAEEASAAAAANAARADALARALRRAETSRDQLQVRVTRKLQRACTVRVHHAAVGRSWSGPGFPVWAQHVSCG